MALEQMDGSTLEMRDEKSTEPLAYCIQLGNKIILLLSAICYYNYCSNSNIGCMAKYGGLDLIR